MGLNPNIENEQTLVEQAKQCPESMGILYDHYFPHVYRYVASKIPSVEDAEDVVSEIFFRVARDLSSFTYRGNGSFRAWLFRIAYRHILDFYRKRSWWRRALPIEMILELPGTDDPPEAVALAREQHQHLQGLLRKLSHRQYHVIALRFFGGLANWEIAQVLNLSDQAVATYLHRGLKRLQRMYMDDPSRKGERYGPPGGVLEEPRNG